MHNHAGAAVAVGGEPSRDDDAFYGAFVVELTPGAPTQEIIDFIQGAVDQRTPR